MTIPTTHVGSLPREQDVVDQLFSREKGEFYDVKAFDSTMTRGVDRVVKKQVNAGIHIVSDGETSKISYSTYVKDRYAGFSGDSPRNPPHDLTLFPQFLKRIAQQGGTPEFSRPMCTQEVSVKSHDDLHKDIFNLTSAMKTHGASRGFMNAASPGVISLFLPNQYYPSRELYLQALADVMQEEYEIIAKSGLDLQIDCPDLALSRHMIFNDLSDDEFLKIAQLHIDILNHALRNVPKESIRVHICWGNYEGPHTCDIPMEKVFHTLMKTKSQYILFESSNPRHAHEWEVFQQNKHLIPDDKILIPGVVDTTTNFVEHPKLIAQRLEKFINIVGKERVYAGSDCGFGTFAGFGAVDPDIAYEKLNALTKGAQMVG
jgi:5-methyltetrahydropteroyltriglutamate--homocysteine methyltransferase